MGFFSSLFGTNQSQTSNSDASLKLEVLIRQIKEISSWSELFKTNSSTISVDDSSCHILKNGEIFFIWRDVYPQKGDTYYFTYVNASGDFLVLKTMKQIEKGKEMYSLNEDSYYIDSVDESVKKIISHVKQITERNNCRLAPDYVLVLG
jgi:hypothetical protein